MVSLRDIIRRHVEDKTLRSLFGKSFDKTPSSEKETRLDWLRKQGNVDKSVDQIIDTFIKDLEKGSPQKKRRRMLTIGYTAINVIFTPLICYGVNEKNWIMMIGVSLMFLIIAYFYIVLSD
ncbi:hypothetical protein [Desulfosporosinus fructosivorans]